MATKVSSLIKTSSALGILMVLGYGISFIKESSIAYYFGVSPEVDAYTMAIQVPIILYSVFSVAIKSVLIPIYSQCYYNENTENSNKFVSNFLSIILIASVLFSIVGALLASPIIYLFAPGFEDYRHDIATKMLQISFATLFCTAFCEIATGVLNVHKKFALPSFGIWVWNISIILSIVLISGIGIYSAIVGNAIGLILEMLFMCYLLKRHIKYKLWIDLKDKRIKDSIHKSVPVMLGIGAAEINRIVDRMMASFVGVGGISILNYASKLNTVFASMLEQTITVVAFPSFAEYSAKKDYKELNRLLNICLSGFTILLIPVSLYLIIFNEFFVSIAFGGGQFLEKDIALTGSALMFFALGLFFLPMRSLLTNVFYSLGDTKTPSYNSIIGIAVNIVLNIILGYYMGVNGLALATSISLMVLFILLLFSLRKFGDVINIKEYINTLYKPVLSGSMLLFSYYSLMHYLGNGFWHCIVAFLISGTVYILCLFLFRVKEIYFIIQKIRNTCKRPILPSCPLLIK